MRIRSVVVPIIVANVIMFMLQVILGDSFTQMFMLISSDVLSRPWILLTSMFLHGSPNHLFFNMYGLFIFGPILEQRIGWKRFLFIYIGSGLIASIISSQFYPAALGASGAIMGMLGTLIILMPQLRLLFFFMIPMPLWMAGIVWALLDIMGTLMPSGTANIAHLAGMGTGLLYGLFLKREKRNFDRHFSKKSHLDDDDIENYIRTGRI